MQTRLLRHGPRFKFPILLHASKWPNKIFHAIMGDTCRQKVGTKNSNMPCVYSKSNVITEGRVYDSGVYCLGRERLLPHNSGYYRGDASCRKVKILWEKKGFLGTRSIKWKTHCKWKLEAKWRLVAINVPSGAGDMCRAIRPKAVQ